MSYDYLKTPITYLKGVGPKRAELLQKELSIFTFGDLLDYFPFRYIDRSKVHKINEITSELAFVQLVGKIRSVETIGGKKNQRLSVILEDDTGTIELVWFKGLKWIKEKLFSNKKYLVFGRPSIFKNQYNIAHPDFELITSEEQIKKRGGFQPIYNSTEKLKNKGLNTKGIEKITRNLIDAVKEGIPENLPDSLIERLQLMERKTAYKNIHFPDDHALLEKARKRLKFEELFFVQLKIIGLKLKSHSQRGHVFSQVGDYFNYFYQQLLPFELTGAQKRVVREIRSDLNSGHQMNRLMQGDVGSGKTLVAIMSMLLALDNGTQSCLMAPTEILAAQHYKTIVSMLKGLNIRVELLTGSTKKTNRTVIHEGLINGDVGILIGTHALIEDAVQFKNLGFTVIDEQHRFGVAQRAKLWKKNNIPPHILVMTATPIPRTLAMTLYGDLDYSVIDELPPGRKPVKTYHLTDSNRLRIFAFLKKEISKGHQAYIVYPLIQESQKMDLKDLMDGYESVAREFPPPEYAVSVVHGQMKPEAKDFEMNRFARGQTQILVSTTVIEVGVDVPNASVMVIENAERFGLSQLHQLRGRVGRGADQAHCLLVTKDKISQDAKTRITTMVQSNDGFRVAEEDMKLRGPGDLEGTQQSGMLNLNISDIVRDEKILKTARNIANEILIQDPGLKKQVNFPIKQYLKLSDNKYEAWGRIS